MSSPNENENDNLQKADNEILDDMVADLLQFPIIQENTIDTAIDKPSEEASEQNPVEIVLENPSSTIFQEKTDNLKEEKGEEKDKSEKENTEREGQKEKNEIVIQTHSGKFHADECAAIALLTSLFSIQGYNVTVIRSRDSSKFEAADILVDVGLEYDPSRHRYDHHQKSCNETWNSSLSNPSNQEVSIPLSSVGLIWRHFGKDILSVYLNTDYFGEFECNDKILTELWNTIYYKIIQDLDAHDNGICMSSIYGSEKSSNLNIPAIISAMNTGGYEDEQNVAFQKAVELIGQIFDIKFREIITTYFKFSQDLEKVDKLLYELNKDVDTPPDANPEHTYLILRENIPTIYKCLNKLDPLCQVVFLILCDEDNSSSFSLKTRRRPGEYFVSICDIAPEEVLRAKMSTEDFSSLLFLHKARFLAKFSTLQAAISCAKASLEYSKEMIVPPVSSVSSIPSISSVSSLNENNEKEKEDILSVKDFKVDKTSVYFTVGFVALGSMFYWLTRK